MKKKILLGMMAVLLVLMRYSMISAGSLDGGYATVRGCVIDEADVREYGVKYVLELEEGKVIVDYQRYPVYEYGDELEVSGMIDFADGGYERYLAVRGIGNVMKASKVMRVGECDLSFVKKSLFEVKAEFVKRLNMLFPDPFGSFMAGILFGARQGISAEWNDRFKALGLTHILAVSGFNVSLIIAFVSGLFGFLGRKKKVVLTVTFIVLFVIFVGASAASVRAGVMGVISLLALWYGRQYLASRALFISAYLMILWNPLVVFFDVGFQLSVLATAGLIFLSPKIEKYFGFLPKFFQIRESMLMTISAQIACLPVILWAFGKVSLISPIANALILPLIPMAMFFGFVSLLGSFFGILFGKILGLPAFLIMKILFFLCDLLA